VQRTVNDKETLVAVRAMEADVTSVPPVVKPTAPTTTNITERMLEPESRETTESSRDGGILSTGNQDANHSQLYTPDAPPSDADKIRLDEAATMAQAAFRGYLVIFSDLIIIAVDIYLSRCSIIKIASLAFGDGSAVSVFKRLCGIG